jgi:methyl-accepting chemotaxis protein
MKSRIFSRSYLLILFLSVPITLAAFIIIYSANKAIDNGNKLKLDIAQTTSINLLDKIDRNFYERFGDVQAFAFNKLAKEALENDSVNEDLQIFINTMTQYYVLYDLMMIADKNGKIIAVNTSDKTGKYLNTQNILGKNVATEEWFKTCIKSSGAEGGTWFSDFLIDPQIKNINNDNDLGWGMAFAAPIKDANGSSIGVWYNFVNWNEVTIKIRQQAEKELRAAYPGSFIVIVNRKNEVIDAEDNALVVKKANVSATSLASNTSFEWEKSELYPSDYQYSIAQAKGAYTYKGKKWKAVTFIPKETITFATFLTSNMLGIYLATLFFLGGAAYLAIIFSKRVSTSLNGLKEVVNNISEGELQESNIISDDEIGEMAMAVNKLISSLKKKVQFAEQIGEGDFSPDYKPVGEKDVLGISLLTMRNNLKISADEDKKRNWATEGLAKFVDILRSNNSKTSNLSENILTNLVKYLKANQGTMFVVNDENEKDVHLEMVACYAYDRKKHLEKRIEIGEGLAGQAYLEKDIIYLTEVPGNYVTITSGLGDANPRCVLIVPLKMNEKVYGIIEIASFVPFQKYMIEFTEKLGESIASTIAATKINDRTSALLAHTQIQAEEMRAQEEEMRQNMEELQATQEEMARKENDYIKQIESLRAELKDLKS